MWPGGLRITRLERADQRFHDIGHFENLSLGQLDLKISVNQPVSPVRGPTKSLSLRRQDKSCASQQLNDAGWLLRTFRFFWFQATAQRLDCRPKK
jgi:hypothetical protein